MEAKALRLFIAARYQWWFILLSLEHSFLAASPTRNAFRRREAAAAAALVHYHKGNWLIGKEIPTGSACKKRRTQQQQQYRSHSFL